MTKTRKYYAIYIAYVWHRSFRSVHGISHEFEKEHEMVEKGVLPYSKHDTPECLHSDQQIWETKVIT